MIEQTLVVGFSQRKKYVACSLNYAKCALMSSERLQDVCLCNPGEYWYLEWKVSKRICICFYTTS